MVHVSTYRMRIEVTLFKKAQRRRRTRVARDSGERPTAVGPNRAVSGGDNA
jgi:hypothetical protein